MKKDLMQSATFFNHSKAGRRKNFKRDSQDNFSNLTIKQAPSPYYTNKTITPIFIVVHCTGYKDPLAVLKQNQVSSHYLIPEQKQDDKLLVYEVVKPPLRAWHAGVSKGRNYTNLNDYAIGIEISMPDYARALQNTTLDFLYFKQFQPSQIETLRVLLIDLQKNFKYLMKISSVTLIFHLGVIKPGR